MLLVLAALPALFWDGGPETATRLREAGITSISVPAAQSESWKSVKGFTTQVSDPATAIKVPPPSVDYRINQASATREPWLNANGWRFLRQPENRFYYDVHGGQAALALAEAFCYGVNAIIHTDDAGLAPFVQMARMLRTAPIPDLPPVADIGFIDDGSPGSGEILNLLVRNNLLVKPIRARESGFKLVVSLGSKEFSREEARNPNLMEHLIRSSLTDERRSIRLYGPSEVVARLTGSGSHVYVQLLNYAGTQRSAAGVRVRVLGNYPKHRLAAADGNSAAISDFAADADATEFTVRDLRVYAAIDLSR